MNEVSDLISYPRYCFRVSTVYLSRAELGEIHGIAPGSAKKYEDDGRLPPADVVIGGGLLRGKVPGLETRTPRPGARRRLYYGYRPETALAWQRPGRGARTDLADDHPPRSSPVRHLSVTEFGEIHGYPEEYAKKAFAAGIFPEPDIIVGGGLLRGHVEGLPKHSNDDRRELARYGYRIDTALCWQRPGQGARTDLHRDGPGRRRR